MGKLITHGEMAKKLGISYQALLKHVRSGSIKPVMSGRKRMYDPEKTIAQFDSNVDLSKRRERPKPAPRPAATRPAISAPTFATEGSKAAALNTARTAKETYLAKLKELEYLEKKGLLLRRDEIRDLEFKAGRALRDRLMALPNQIRPFLIDGAMPEIERTVDDIIRDMQKDIENIAS